MLLSFSTHYPWEQESHFERKIKGELFDWKNHTFRTGHRFKPGYKIHFWMGNPRNKHQDPTIHEFNPPLIDRFTWYRDPKMFATQGAFDTYRKVMQATEQPHDKTVPICTAIEHWKMSFKAEDQFHKFKFEIGDIKMEAMIDQIDSPDLFYYDWSGNYGDLIRIAKNDGFEQEEEFIRWFYRSARRAKKEEIEGQLIHWTNPEKACYDIGTAMILLV